MSGHPVDRIVWLPRNALHPNSYNPNKQAPPEKDLLKTSIFEDGWTQPIVATSSLEIIDGFHRWGIAADPEIAALSDGRVPVAVLDPKDATSQRMSTIRHNRARGTHGVLPMAEIVGEMVRRGVSVEELCRRLGMEPEEVFRLALRVGIPKSSMIAGAKWSRSWTPK